MSVGSRIVPGPYGGRGLSGMCLTAGILRYRLCRMLFVRRSGKVNTEHRVLHVPLKVKDSPVCFEQRPAFVSILRIGRTRLLENHVLQVAGFDIVKDIEVIR